MKDNLKKFLNVKNATLTTADLYFYGDIVSDWWGAWDDTAQYPEAIRDFLTEHEGKNLNIYINSGGGSVFAGMAIYNMLLRHKGRKTVYIDGIAASIASVIALAGDEIIMPSNAFLMIHKPQSECEGNSDDFRKAAELLDAAETGIMNVYKAHLTDGTSAEELQRMLNAETWLNGFEAAKLFQITVSEAKDYAAKISDDIMSRYANPPQAVLCSAKEKNEKQAAEKTAQKITNLVIRGLSKGD